MNINENAIEELTRILIKEDFKNKDKDIYLKMTKKDLIKFSIKLVKTIERYK